jgi:hypothetical protein
LAEHWKEAQKFLERGLLARWVVEDLKDYDLRSFLDDMDSERALATDAKLALTIARMDQNLPLLFRGYTLNKGTLAHLAREAVDGKAEAQEMIVQLYQSELLKHYAQLPEHSRTHSPSSSWALDLDREWHSLGEQYNQRLAMARQGGAPSSFEIDQRETSPALLLSLLLPGFMSDLRSLATAAATATARACPWYATLCQQSSAEASSFLLMRLLAPTAESQAEQRRLDELAGILAGRARALAEMVNTLEARLRDFFTHRHEVERKRRGLSAVPFLVWGVMVLGAIGFWNGCVAKGNRVMSTQLRALTGGEMWDGLVGTFVLALVGGLLGFGAWALMILSMGTDESHGGILARATLVRGDLAKWAEDFAAFEARRSGRAVTDAAQRTLVAAHRQATEAAQALDGIMHSRPEAPSTGRFFVTWAAPGVSWAVQGLLTVLAWIIGIFLLGTLLRSCQS